MTIVNGNASISLSTIVAYSDAIGNIFWEKQPSLYLPGTTQDLYEGYPPPEQSFVPFLADSHRLQSVDYQLFPNGIRTREGQKYITNFKNVIPLQLVNLVYSDWAYVPGSFDASYEIIQGSGSITIWWGDFYDSDLYDPSEMIYSTIPPDPEFWHKYPSLFVVLGSHSNDLIFNVNYTWTGFNPNNVPEQIMYNDDVIAFDCSQGNNPFNDLKHIDCIFLQHGLCDDIKLNIDEQYKDKTRILKSGIWNNPYDPYDDFNGYTFVEMDLSTISLEVIWDGINISFFYTAHEVNLPGLNNYFFTNPVSNSGNIFVPAVIYRGNYVTPDLGNVVSGFYIKEIDFMMFVFDTVTGNQLYKVFNGFNVLEPFAAEKYFYESVSVITNPVIFNDTIWWTLWTYDYSIDIINATPTYHNYIMSYKISQNGVDKDNSSLKYKKIDTVEIGSNMIACSYGTTLEPRVIFRDLFVKEKGLECYDRDLNLIWASLGGTFILDMIINDVLTWFDGNNYFIFCKGYIESQSDIPCIKCFKLLNKDDKDYSTSAVVYQWVKTYVGAEIRDFLVYSYVDAKLGTIPVLIFVDMYSLHSYCHDKLNDNDSKDFNWDITFFSPFDVNDPVSIVLDSNSNLYINHNYGKDLISANLIGQGKKDTLNGNWSYSNGDKMQEIIAIGQNNIYKAGTSGLLSIK